MCSVFTDVESNLDDSDTQYDFNNIVDASALGEKFAEEPVGNIIACWGCKMAARDIIRRKSCSNADSTITAICEAAFYGPEDPLSEICAFSFIKACPTLAIWMAEKNISPE